MLLAHKIHPVEVRLQTIVPGDDAKQSYPALDQKQYFELLWDLAAKGVLATKRSEVIAIPLLGLGIVTEGKTNNRETVKDFGFDNVTRMLFDASLYTVASARQTVAKIFSEYGHLISHTPSELTAKINSGEVSVRVAASAEGMYTSTAKNFAVDYEATDLPCVSRVKQGTGRLCLNVNHAFDMPVQWGTFGVPAGGTVAVRFEDIDAMTKALQKIADGKATIEDELYVNDKTGRPVAKFDVYGMYDGFFASNYIAAKDVPEDAKRALNAFQAKAGNKPAPSLGS